MHRRKPFFGGFGFCSVLGSNHQAFRELDSVSVLASPWFDLSLNRVCIPKNVDAMAIGSVRHVVMPFIHLNADNMGIV